MIEYKRAAFVMKPLNQEHAIFGHGITFFRVFSVDDGEKHSAIVEAELLVVLDDIANDLDEGNSGTRRDVDTRVIIVVIHGSGFNVPDSACFKSIPYFCYVLKTCCNISV